MDSLGHCDIGDTTVATPVCAATTVTVCVVVDMRVIVVVAPISVGVAPTAWF